MFENKKGFSLDIAELKKGYNVIKGEDRRFSNVW